MIQVAVMGYGTIGSGVVEVLETNKDKITEKTGKEIAVKYILDLREFPGDPHEAQIVHDFEIIEKDECDIYSSFSFSSCCWSCPMIERTSITSRMLLTIGSMTRRFPKNQPKDNG